MNAYIQGFITKCAEFGVDYVKLLKYAQAAAAGTQPQKPVRGWKPGGLEYNAAQAAYNADKEGFKNFATNWRQQNSVDSFSSRDAGNRAMMSAYLKTLTPEARAKLMATNEFKALSAANAADRQTVQNRYKENASRMFAGNENMTGPNPGERTVENNYGGTIDTTALRQRRENLAEAKKLYGQAVNEQDPTTASNLIDKAQQLEYPRSSGSGDFEYVDPRTGNKVQGRGGHAANMQGRAVAENAAQHDAYLASHPGSQRIRTYAHNRAAPNVLAGESNRFTLPAGSAGTGKNIQPARQWSHGMDLNSYPWGKRRNYHYGYLPGSWYGLGGWNVNSL